MTGNRQGLCNWLTRPLRRRFAASLALVTAMLALAAPGSLPAQQPAWKTGAALHKELEIPLTVLWQQREVRNALSSIAKSTGVAIWLDRRIDPGRKIDLAATDEPLRDVLLKVAEQLDGGVSLVGSVVYVGPKATTGKLASLAALKRGQAGSLSAETRTRLAKSEAWAWPDVAEPRKIAAELATRGGVRIAGSELIPHDLWPAASWPQMPWTDRITLLLAGFDLTFEPAGASELRLVAVPEVLIFDKIYTPRGDAKKAAAVLGPLVPDAKITIASGKLAVTASAEDHDRIDRLLRGETVKTTRVTAGQKRYTLTVDGQPAGAVIKTLAAQLGKEMAYDPVLADKLQTKVTFAVDKVPLEELLDKTLLPLGLSYRIGDKSIEILAP